MAARICSGVGSDVTGFGGGDGDGYLGSRVGFVWGVVEGDPPGGEAGMEKWGAEVGADWRDVSDQCTDRMSMIQLEETKLTLCCWETYSSGSPSLSSSRLLNSAWRANSSCRCRSRAWCLSKSS